MATEEGFVDALRREARGERTLALTLLSAAIAALVLSPVAWILLEASTVGFTRAVNLLAGARMVQVLVNSLLLVGIVTGASVVLGVPLAILTSQTDLPFRRFFTVAISLPLVVPSYIGAFAYFTGFGEDGALTAALADAGIAVSLPPMTGLVGTAVVLTLFTFPYVFLSTRASLASFDGTLLEAARTLNHSRTSAFLRVVFPQVLPGIAAGGLLVALYALSDFGTPAIMGYDVFTRILFVNYYDFQLAALLSVQLLAVTAVIIALESAVEAGDASGYASSNPDAATRLELGWLKGPALALCSLVVVAALAVPIAVLVLWLVRDTGQTGFGYAFSWEYGWNSLSVSVLAAVASILFALPVAYNSVTDGGRLSRLAERGTYVGYAVPGIVVGVALVALGSKYAPFLYGQIPLLVFAYVVRFLPQAVGSVRSSVLQVDGRLTEAARTLGHSPRAAFRKVTLPLVAPGIVSGAALVFLTTMKELPATLLLRPGGFETLVTYIWMVQESRHYGKAAVPALVLVGISAVSMLVLLSRGGNDVT
ncbi:iron ABC transporter permease [Halorubellus litoreus]|uniref:ABC transporter permease n=1 Tax=Halorubellus litoreus TaxID=755308 RepID=A0ABD5VKQ1_9EURY